MWVSRGVLQHSKKEIKIPANGSGTPRAALIMTWSMTIIIRLDVQDRPIHLNVVEESFWEDSPSTRQVS